MDAFLTFLDGVFSSGKGIVGLGCIFGGLGFSAIGVSSLRSAIKARDWVEGHARFLKVDVKEHVFRRERSYSLAVEYEFNVADQLYRGNRVKLTVTSDKRRKPVQRLAEEFHSNMRQGHMVPVFYNPTDPAQSVLSRDLEPGLLVATSIVAVMFFAFSYHLLVSPFDFSGIESLLNQLQGQLT